MGVQGRRKWRKDAVVGELDALFIRQASFSDSTGDTLTGASFSRNKKIWFPSHHSLFRAAVCGFTVS